MTTENQLAVPSFDRMRNMLVRAAEVRESEQQQIFDALDDIYARLAPVDSLGAIRKRLTELPDRTEVSVLAERLDEAMSRLEAQDKAIATVATSVEAIVDKLAKPFAQLDGRLDAVAARFEGVAGRMDGLEDKLANIHRRLDELGGHLGKQDDRIEAVPSAVQGPVRERVDVLEATLKERIDRLDTETKDRLGANTDAMRTALTETAETVDASERLDKLGGRLEQVTNRLDTLTTRLDKVEEGFATQLSDLGGAVKTTLSNVEGTLAKQPDSDYVSSVVKDSHEESVRRIGGQLDEAMATFGELMLGGGPAAQMISVNSTPPTPRQPARRRNGRAPKSDSKSKSGNNSSADGAESADN